MSAGRAGSRARRAQWTIETGPILVQPDVRAASHVEDLVGTFEILDEIADVETVATGAGVRIRAWLNEIAVADCWVDDTPQTRVLSDHGPVVLDLMTEAGRPPRAAEGGGRDDAAARLKQ